MKELFSVSFNAVLQLVLVALVGVWLARKNIIDDAARRSIAKIILWVMLPALLVASLSKEADPHAVHLYFGIILAAPFLILCGTVTGHALSTLFNVPGDLQRITNAASTYGNASYIPLPFMAVICLTAPFVSSSPQIATSNSVTYISIYLMCYSPMLWFTAFPYLSGKGIRQLNFKQLINPPLMASAIGITIAFIPPVRNLFHAPGAPLNVVVDALNLLAKGVFPCALLILGANLVSSRQAANSKDAQKIPLGAYFAVILGKLIIMPVFGLAYTTIAWKYNFIPHDPLLALVILIEAAVPPANNLIIMCQTHEKGEKQMARLLFVAYCTSVVTLTLWTVFFLKTVNSWNV